MSTGLSSSYRRQRRTVSPLPTRCRPGSPTGVPLMNVRVMITLRSVSPAEGRGHKPSGATRACSCSRAPREQMERTPLGVPSAALLAAANASGSGVPFNTQLHVPRTNEPPPRCCFGPRQQHPSTLNDRSPRGPGGPRPRSTCPCCWCSSPLPPPHPPAAALARMRRHALPRPPARPPPLRARPPPPPRPPACPSPLLAAATS
jgi:hypothetical protein